MKQPSLDSSTAELIRRLPSLPKDRLLVLWKENFGKPAGSIRAELMIPVLAFRRRPAVALTPASPGGYAS